MKLVILLAFLVDCVLVMWWSGPLVIVAVGLLLWAAEIAIER